MANYRRTMAESNAFKPEKNAENSHGVISIITPVYNEEENIPELYDNIKLVMEQLGRPWELIFVDDGSRDQSPKLMEAISLKDGRVKSVELRRNFGQTAALAAGIDHARGSIIIPMDADLQNDPTDIPRLLAKLEEGYDIVSGWRKSRKDSLIRTFPSFLANKLASWVTGVTLHDFGCTLKAYRSEVLEGIQLYGDLHRFIPALASSVGARVAEIEVNHHPRKFGKSKYGIARTFKVLIDLLTLKLLLAYNARPMRIFGGLGFLMMSLGAMCGIATILMKLLLGTDMTGNPLLFMTVLAILGGIQLTGLGFLGEINMRTYYETQRKPIYVVREVFYHQSEELPEL
ncbi:MAG TPA: glycosyltransferase family 2 protein [Dehalococcoidia bacterium]|nr:glycosyltransferase family 2 protein [Dehalococcoidia bacterium]